MKKPAIAFFVLLLAVVCASCSKKNPLDTGEMGTVAINCIFPDERRAKFAVSPTDSTATAFAYVYYGEDKPARTELNLVNRRYSSELQIIAGLTIIIKVVGYNKFMGITYQGKSDEITVVYNITITADIYMNKNGFVEIPAGSFSMGSESGEKNEQPVHTVSLDGFFMSATEVTAAQWENIMSKIGSYFKIVKPYYIAPSYDNTSPISNIIPGDMAIFCNILSSMSGYTPCYSIEFYSTDYESTDYECDFTKNGYRLPTEAEWEYACRAGTSTPFNTGSSETDLAETSWYSGNGKHQKMPVGEKKPNRWGLYDMHGNISEMCNDTYIDDDFGSSPVSNPGEPVLGQSIYIVRGGNYSSPPYECRSAYRGSMVKRQNFKYSKETTVGFRIVRKTD